MKPNTPRGMKIIEFLDIDWINKYSTSIAMLIAPVPETFFNYMRGGACGTDATDISINNTQLLSNWRIPWFLRIDKDWGWKMGV